MKPLITETSDKAVALTLKTAQMLVRKELGLAGNMLREDLDTCGDARVYSMWSGRMEVVVQNDWYDHNGLLCLRLRHPTGNCIYMYYNPLTLEDHQEMEP